MTSPLHIISANDLRSGLNVYYTGDGGEGCWDTDIAKATAYEEDAVDAAFDQAKRDMDANIVVDCLIVPVDEKHTPLTTREKIRAGGPSTRYGHKAAR